MWRTSSSVNVKKKLSLCISLSLSLSLLPPVSVSISASFSNIRVGMDILMRLSMWHGGGGVGVGAPGGRASCRKSSVATSSFCWLPPAVRKCVSCVCTSRRAPWPWPWQRKARSIPSQDNFEDAPSPTSPAARAAAKTAALWASSSAESASWHRMPSAYNLI